MALYFNTRYYTIDIFPQIKYMTTIATKFGNFIYNCLLMGMCPSSKIFQTKLGKFISYTAVVNMHIYDILAISKNKFHKHIYQIIVNFSRLFNNGLKVNALKCILGLKDIPYQGYITTQEGIKPYLKKLHVTW